MRAFLLLLMAYAAFAQCESSELRTQFESLPDFQTDTLTYREVVDANRAFAAQHPGRVLAEQRLIFILHQGWWGEEERQKEIARYRAMPDREMGEFLEAALRLSYRDPRQLAARFPELAKRICNAPIVPMGRLRNAQTRADAIPVALSALGERTDNAAAIGWWEVIDAMNHEHDTRLPDAISTLRAMNRYRNETWVSETLQAFRLVNDKSGDAELRAKLADLRPDSRWGIDAALNAWRAAHPPKNTSEAGFSQQSQETIAFLHHLQQERPHSIAAAMSYLSATQYGVKPGLGAEEALYAVDLATQCERDYPFAIIHIDEAPLKAARVYLDRGVRLDEVPRQTAEQVRRMRVEYNLALSSASAAQQANERLQRTELHANTLLAEYWLHKKDAVQAQSFAELARSNLAQIAPLPDASDNYRRGFDYEQAQWLKMVKLVGIEAKPLTDARIVDWAKVAHVPFREFSVTDLQGRHWDLAAWKGKAVFVNVWGTWCVPCRAELPNIQKLYDDSKDSADRLVITVNVDEDKALTRKFLLDNGYTFPVIASSEFAELVDGTKSLPQSRVVDPQNRMLHEPVDMHCATCTAAVRKLMDGLAAK